MSDELRREASEIALRLRRYLERARAAGHGELLVEAAAAARRAHASVPAPAPRGPVAIETMSATQVVAERPVGGWAAPEAPSLFEPATRGTAADASRMPQALPLPHPPLNPIGAERVTIAGAALPVLEQVATEARACTKCGLCETRIQAVPGVGSARAGIVFVGEAPGADEDAQGEPFVGRAGQLLTRIIKAMDKARLVPGVPLSRETVYICNVLKCRPPENRNPLPHEIESCAPYLRRQLAAIQPRIICCLGKFAAELLVGVKGTIGSLRGKVYRYQGAKLIVTYHPAACLRNPNYKRPVWEDMQLLAREYQSS